MPLRETRVQLEKSNMESSTKHKKTFAYPSQKKCALSKLRNMRAIGFSYALWADVGPALQCSAGSTPIVVGRNLFRLVGHDRNAVKLFFIKGETVIPQTRRARIASPIGKRDSGAANQSRTIGRTRLSD